MRWGLIGSGTIGAQFARDISVLPDSKIIAVYSRSKTKAEAFAQKYDIPTVHGTITSLLQDKNIDNIYVCVPNNLHKEMVLAAIEAGKNVLCEKPMGVNKAEVTEMVSAAKQKNVLLMEAMWTRFFPAMEKALSFCNNGTAGNVRSVSIDLGYDGEVAGERGTWHFDNRYGTGALLDMGIYAVFLSHYIFGKKPDHIYGHAYVNNGIDEYNTATLIYGNSHTVLSSSIVNDTSCSVHINCENGVVTIPTYWWHPDKCIFTPKGGDPITYSFPVEKEGLQYEIAAFEEAAKSGLKEHPLVKHQYSIDVVEIMDNLRSIWELKYEQDEL